MYKKILFPLCLILLWGCQDTKRTEKAVQKNKEKIEDSSQIYKETEEVPKRPYANLHLDTIHRLKQEQLIPFLTEYGKKNTETHAILSTKFGEIEIELFKDTPLHRANFVRLAKLGYFNTTYFYRVAKGFVIQAGNSDNPVTGTFRKKIGKYLIPKEFRKSHQNNYGAVGMAKYSKQNVSKASSPFEFYIVMDKKGAHHLDFQHTVFGKVIRGMDVAEKINQVKTTEDEWPINNVEIKINVSK